jgi:hypothetical protein
MSFSDLLRNPQTVWILIPLAALMFPISAIILSGLTVIVKLVIQHRERMAKIEQGFDPDAPPQPAEVRGGNDR